MTETIQLLPADDIPSAVEALNAYRYSDEFEDLPEFYREKLLNAVREVSPVASICNAVEALWAARQHLGDKGRETAVQLTAFATPNGWWGLSNDGRGLKIVRALRHDAGESVEYDSDDDPAPLSGYVSPAPAGGQLT